MKKSSNRVPCDLLDKIFVFRVIRHIPRSVAVFLSLSLAILKAVPPWNLRSAADRLAETAQTRDPGRSL